MENSNRGSNSFGAFLMGVIVGALLVFLLGTKKGKKILEALSEEGMDILKKVDPNLEFNEDLQDEDLAPKNEVESPKLIAKTTKKRFFRGVKRAN